MRRLLPILIALLMLGKAEAINFYTTFDDGTVGNLVDVTNLTRSTVSEGTGWFWHNQSLAKTYISNSVSSFNGGYFSIFGSNWFGTGTRSAAYRTEKPPANEYMLLTIPTSATNKMLQVTWGCMVWFDLTNSTTQTVTYDNISDGIFYFQVNVLQQSTNIYFSIEGTPTNFGAVPGSVYCRHWYWVTCLSDMANGICKVHVYDAQNSFADLGEATATIPVSSVPTDQSFNMTLMEFGGLYSSLPSSPGYMMFDNYVMDWNEPLSSYPLLPITQPIIPANDRTDWVPGLNIGVRGGIPVRTNVSATVWSTNTVAQVASAISSAPANGVVLLGETNPANIYDWSAGLSINRNDVSVRGNGPANTKAFGHIILGHSAAGGLDTPITYGSTRGSTNLGVAYVTNQFGDTIIAGDAFMVSGFFPDTNANHPIISRAGAQHILRQPIIVSSITGTNITFWPPLVWDWTNNPVLMTFTEFGATNRQMVHGIGLENFTMSPTNELTGGYDGSVAMIDLSMVRDSWLSNMWAVYPNNYAIEIESGCFNQFDYCLVQKAIPGSTTSHAGFLAANGSGNWIVNSSFADQIAGVEYNDGFVGNAITFNYFTNNTANADILVHNTHPMMNLVEGNVLKGKMRKDGYFGSSSFDTIVRNQHDGTLDINRDDTHENVVGNVLGTYPSTPLYDQYTNDYTVWPVIRKGFPLITGNHYNYQVPNQAFFNWPGSYLNAFTGGTVLTNGIYTLTNDQLNFTASSQVAAPNQTLNAATTNAITGQILSSATVVQSNQFALSVTLPCSVQDSDVAIIVDRSSDGGSTWSSNYYRATVTAPSGTNTYSAGSFGVAAGSNWYSFRVENPGAATITKPKFTMVASSVLVGMYTNIPSGVGQGQNYPLRFQSLAGDTNLYFPQDGTIVLTAAAGTSSNLLLSSVFTASNNWRVYIGGQNAYQGIDMSNSLTHIISGNVVNTNSGGTVVWDPNIPSHAIPASYLYTNGPPSWWDTNWPSIGPDVAGYSQGNPAQRRFIALLSAGGGGGGGGGPVGGGASVINAATANVGTATMR